MNDNIKTAGILAAVGLIGGGVGYGLNKLKTKMDKKKAAKQAETADSK